VGRGNRAPGAGARRARAVTTRARTWLIAGAVALLTAVVFLPTVENGFVDLDDEYNFLENTMYRGFAPPQLRWMFTTFHLGPWQPLSWLSLAADHALWGLDPRGYHLTNLVLHAASAALLFVLARRLLRYAGLSEVAGASGAAFGALLWAIHPLRVESVAWVTERRDVLSGVFFLLGLLAYTLPPERPGRLPAALAASALALLAKASTMVLPVVLVALDMYPLRRLGGTVGWTTPAARRVWGEKLWFVGLAAPVALLAVVGQRASGALVSLHGLSPAQRIATAMYGLGFYLWKTVVPVSLRPMYEYPHDFAPSHPLALAGAATALGVAVLALVLRRRVPGIAIALVVYLAAVAPVLGVVAAGPQVAADRYTYLAALGWSVLAGGLVAVAPGRPALRLALAGAVLLCMGSLTVRQIRIWRDGPTLWSYTAAVDPTNAFAQLRLAEHARRSGDLDGAIALVRESLRLSPWFGEAHYDLGTLLTAAGALDEARAHFETALRLNPPTAKRLTNYGFLLARSGRPAEAITQLRAALQLDPDLVGAHVNLAGVLAATGDRDGAAAELQTAIRLDPADARLPAALARLRAAGAHPSGSD
jgi:tetratricopeptide (TPR) repeat protein